jgi:hypothetical protein
VLQRFTKTRFSQQKARPFQGNVMIRDAEPRPRVPRYDSCPRCGGVGHPVQQCQERIPLLTELQGTIHTKIARALARTPRTWVPDQFGLFQPAPYEGAAPPPATFATAVFCFNCGRPGHTEAECREPTFAALLERFGDVSDRSAQAVSARDAVIAALGAAPPTDPGS